MTFENMAVH